MGKNALFRIAAALLVITLITSCFVSRTFAIYSSSVTKNVSANIDKWMFTVNDKDISKETFTFSLFDESAAGKDVIAPGTSGDFELVLNNVSDIPANYNVSFDIQNNGVPIEFSLDNGSYLDNIAEQSGVLAALNGTRTIKIDWKWERGNAPTSNTLYGKQVSVTATVVANQ